MIQDLRAPDPQLSRRLRLNTLIRLRWGWNDGEVHLQVIDDGPGFQAEILDRIGEPYMTTRPGGSENGGGLGLGLFIAKTLLERSGASVDFRNAGEAGKGALAEVAWPREAFIGAAAEREAA